MPDDLVLVRVAVQADVGLHVAPRERGSRKADVRDEAAVARIDLVLGDVEVWIIGFARRQQLGHPAPGTGRRQIVFCVVGLRPDQQAEQWAVRPLPRLIVGRIAVVHRQIGGQPGIDGRLGRAGQVGAVVLRIGYDAPLLRGGRIEPVVHPAVGSSPAEDEVVSGRVSRLEEAGDVVVERRTGGIRRAEVLERAEAAGRHRGRTIDALDLRADACVLRAERIAVLHAGDARFASLCGDDDGTVCRVDAIERGGFRSLQNRNGLDVFRIEIGGPVGEVQPAIGE